MDIKDTIELISSIGTLLLSILALMFSIYAFRKVSLKGDFKKKQLEIIYELIEVLQDTIIHVSSRDHNNPRVTSSTMFRFFRLDFSEKKFEDFIKFKRFLVTGDPDKEYKFIKYSEHPYMDKNIANILRKFIAYTYEPVDSKKLNSYVVLGGLGLPGYEIDLYEIKDNPVYSDFESFAKQCKKLDEAIHKWLKSIGITDFNKKEIIE